MRRRLREGRRRLGHVIIARPRLAAILLWAMLSGCSGVSAPQKVVPLPEVAREQNTSEVVNAVKAAIAAPGHPGSLETIVRYGTDTRYYRHVRGWLHEERGRVSRALSMTRNPAARGVLQQQLDFYRAAIRRIDLE